jgi:hypothetical protein
MDPHPDPPLFKGREPQACEANPVELGSTVSPPLKKGRVRVGIQNRKFKKINLNLLIRK